MDGSLEDMAEASKAASELGRKGGLVKSERKAKSSADKRYEAPPARQFIQDNPEARVPLPGLWMLAPYAPGQVFYGR
jgi:hypothetical protein